MGHIGNLAERALHRALRIVSPRRAALRAHFARMADDREYSQTVFALMNARGYKAAENGRNSGTWLGGSGSGDAELSGNLQAMRNRSRELDRDDSIASGIYATMTQNIVGRELRPQAKTGDREKNRRLESIWRDRKRWLFPAEGISVGRVQRRVCHRKMVDGDVFIKPAKASAEEPVWFEVVEGDRVQTPFDATPAAGNRIQDGIEKDQYGRPVAAYILRRHPGDNVLPGQAGGIRDYATVPAGMYWQSLRGERGGLTRGEPLLHSILQDVRDLDTLMLAAMKRMQIAACLALFIESEVPIDEMFDATAQKYGFRLDQDIEPGMIYKLFPGEKASSFTPNLQVPELERFVISLASRIGAAIGMTWQYVLKDFHSDTYSSARTAQLACEPTWDSEQKDLCDDLWTPVWNAVMQDARLRGDARLAGISDEDIATVTWQGDGRKWVDPEGQANAKQIARRLGIETFAQQCAEIGKDWEENLDAIAEAITECKARGMTDAQIDQIVFGVDPKAAAAAPEAANQADDEQKAAAQRAREELAAMAARVENLQARPPMNLELNVGGAKRVAKVKKSPDGTMDIEMQDSA